MRTDLVKPGQVVEFRRENTTHTGTVKTVGRNGADEIGSEVVIDNIYPHIYGKPTVTMHGGDLILQDGPSYPQRSNHPAFGPDRQREEAERARLANTQYRDDPNLSVAQNAALRADYRGPNDSRFAGDPNYPNAGTRGPNDPQYPGGQPLNPPLANRGPNGELLP